MLSLRRLMRHIRPYTTHHGGTQAITEALHSFLDLVYLRCSALRFAVVKLLVPRQPLQRA
jgi:hypothetical protein